MTDENKPTHNIKSLNKRLEDVEAKLNTSPEASEETKPEDMSRIERLEKIIRLLSHMTGQDAVLRKYGLPKYDVSKKDMGKYK